MNRPNGGMVPVVQAYAYSKYLGHLNLTFDDAGEPDLRRRAIRSCWTAAVTPDAELEAAGRTSLARPHRRGAQPRWWPKPPRRSTAAAIACRAVECAMGNLVAEAMLDRVKDQGVTVAIQNGGGLRACIDTGPVTMGEVLTVLPFQNTLSTFEVDGATVVAALENGVSQVEEGAGRFPQVAGLKYTFDPAAPAGSRMSRCDGAGRADAWGRSIPAATYWRGVEQLCARRR
ncbi:MAG: 5'-nucleotidase C-terminal domain-containing protein [Gemmobacter sp.]|nr:5'-nucleotidase C-terminal domain-containing protein [Gemmobacter sp.]